MVFEIFKASKKDLRNFGYVFGIIVALLFGLLLPYLFSHPYPKWPWYFAAVFILAATVFPNVLRPIYIAWMGFGFVMNKITTPIIMTAAFFVVLFPVGLLMRLFRYDSLGLTIDSTLDTYRKNSSKPSRDHMEKPF